MAEQLADPQAWWLSYGARVENRQHLGTATRQTLIASMQEAPATEAVGRGALCISACTTKYAACSSAADGWLARCPCATSTP